MENYQDYECLEIKTIHELYFETVARHADETAFEYSGGAVTYSELNGRVLRAASRMLPYQGKQVFVGVLDPLKFAIAYFSCILSGCVAVLGAPTDYNVFQKSGGNAQLCITDSFVFDGSAEKVPFGAYSVSDTDAVCTILHSSGTEGAPKWVMLSHANICSNIVSGLRKYLMQRVDVFYNIIPYYHAFGLICDFLAPLFVGAKICVPDKKELFFSQMPVFCPTALNVPPAVAARLNHYISAAGSAAAVTGGRLKKILCGGAGLAAEISKTLRKQGINALGCYGLSECSPCVSVNRDEYYKDGSAGIPLGCNDVSIGSDGEVLVSGTNVMKGYYGDEAETRRILSGGVLHTGDLGRIDGDGFLFITGRKKNVIVFDDGTKCSPETYEAQIIAHTDAEEALIRVGNGHAMRLEAVIYVEDNSKQDEIRKYIADLDIKKRIASVLFTNTPLPKNNLGKVQRNYEKRRRY